MRALLSAARDPVALALGLALGILAATPCAEAPGLGSTRSPPMRDRLSLPRDFLVLAGGVGLCLTPLFTLLLDAHMTVAGLAGLIAGCAALLAVLGLFMTWGDAGSRLGNAASSLAVLLGLIGAVVLLLLWAASASGGGE